MTTAVTVGVTIPAKRVVPAPIPFHRIVMVEARKAFDTRAGKWLLGSVVLLAVIASTAVTIFASDAGLTYSNFGAAIGVPMAVVLPVIAVLSVSSEWSQRTALATFTLVPGRGRSIAAKAVVTLIVGVVSMVIAMGVGAVGTLIGSAVNGVDPVWDMSGGLLATVVLGQVLGMFSGFMLGVLFRSSAAAIIGYFVYAMVFPGIFGALSSANTWFAKHQGWFDANYTQAALFNGGLTGTQWAQLAVTWFVWLIVPLVVGLRFLLRSEIK